MRSWTTGTQSRSTSPRQGRQNISEAQHLQLGYALKGFLALLTEVVDVSKLFNPQSFLTAIKQVCAAHRCRRAEMFNGCDFVERLPKCEARIGPPARVHGGKSKQISLKGGSSSACDSAVFCAAWILRATSSCSPRRLRGHQALGPEDSGQLSP